VTVAAGIDVGNATTEVVLGRLSPAGVEVIAAGRVPTRRLKGSPDSLAGAVALVRRLERTHGVTVERAVAAPAVRGGWSAGPAR
jgi:cell division ATPase FtsA